MEIKTLNCSACGAPIAVPDELDYINCTSCGSFLSVQRGEGYIALRVAGKIAQAITDSGKETQSAILESAAVTREELQRMQLTQELSAAQLQFSNIQAEARALEREQPNPKIAGQLKELHAQAYPVMDKIRNLEIQLAAPDPKRPSAFIEGAERELAWIDAEMNALSQSNYPQREDAERRLTARRQSLTSMILDLKVQNLKGTLPSFEITDLPRNDLSQAQAYLEALVADQNSIGSLAGSPEGKIVVTELKERLAKVQQAIVALSPPSPAPVTSAGAASPAEIPGSVKPKASGCLLAFLSIAGMGFVGIILLLITSVDKPQSEMGFSIGLFFLCVAIGACVGAWQFWRRAAPGAYIRGVLGLPDIALDPSRAKGAARSSLPAKLAAGAFTLLTMVSLTLALLGFIDQSDSNAIGAVGVIGFLLSAAATLIVVLRTTLRKS